MSNFSRNFFSWGLKQDYITITLSEVLEGLLSMDLDSTYLPDKLPLIIYSNVIIHLLTLYIL